MSAHSHSHASADPAASQKTAMPKSGVWPVIRSLLPYLWDYRWRVALALTFLVTAKFANIGVPLVMKQIVDSLDKDKAMLAVPVMLLVAYGLLRRAQRPLAKGEIDNFAEDYLRERFSLDIDFEIHDALNKLERMGLVTREGETYTPIAPDEALRKIDAAWDGLFSFSARR